MKEAWISLIEISTQDSFSMKTVKGIAHALPEVVVARIGDGIIVPWWLLLTRQLANIPFLHYKIVCTLRKWYKNGNYSFFVCLFVCSSIARTNG